MDNEELAYMLEAVAAEIREHKDINNGFKFESDVCLMYNAVVDKDCIYKRDK